MSAVSDSLCGKSQPLYETSIVEPQRQAGTVRVRLAILAMLALVGSSLAADSARAGVPLVGCEDNKCVTIGGCSIQCNRCEEKKCVLEMAE
jgi:hypothetical protein